MSDPGRLAQLERLHASDPGSPRAFLQLAEEYRRAGRLADAVRVLEPGIRRHPSYLSAQFALGRIRLDLGDAEAACDLLSEVVAKDPTHMVATKLLIEAQLRRGDAAEASETLDRYRLLNDGDPEIADLERRIQDLSADLRPAEVVAPKSEPALETKAISEPAPRRAGVVAHQTGSGEPFAELVSTVDRDFHLAALTAAGIFAPPPEAPSERHREEPKVAVGEAHPATEAEAPEPSAEALAPRPPSPPPPAAAPEAAAARATSMPARSSGDEAEATVTLGQLYLDQQHYARAEKIFRAILDREPANAAALLGLAEAEQFRPRPLTADELLRWWAGEDGGGSRRRPGRSDLLGAYLARIRQRRRVDVS